MGKLLIGLFLLIVSIVFYNLAPEKTSLHTSNVSGSSGELKCTSSCVVKENEKP